LLASHCLSQDVSDCECEDGTITLCYIPDDPYCYYEPLGGACGYSFDGRFMDNFLAQKLQNPNLFGNNGVVTCPIEIQRLTEVESVEDINDMECDIIFTGNFIFDTIGNYTNADVTALPSHILRNIREWSVLCPTNLVITTQAEAEFWGYTAADQNRNPNVPTQDAESNDIFDGPFGPVESFLQGGTYQGVFIDQPETGSILLSVDDSRRPTMVVDVETNDIILGDVGIMCGGGAGSISWGPEINNSNDRLVCNLFALGCLLAGSGISTNNYLLCPGSEVLSPGGDTLKEEGAYFDTLKTTEFCDSIVLTFLNFTDTLYTEFNYEGCQGDGHNVQVGDVFFDEFNPRGSKKFVTEGGCDSIVLVEFEFYENTDFYITDRICIGEEVLVDTFVFNNENLEGIVGLINSKGCDSIVYVDLIKSSEIPDIEIDNFHQVLVGEDYQFDLDIEGEVSSIEWLPSDGVSCPTCPDPYINQEIAPDTLEVIFKNDDGCQKRESIIVEYDCPIYVPNIISLAEDDINSTLKVGTSCKIDQFQFRLFDRWGNQVFDSQDPDFSWAINQESKILSQGVYLYHLKYSAYNVKGIKYGNITMVR